MALRDARGRFVAGVPDTIARTCPFCGGPWGAMYWAPKHNGFQVWCHNCNAKGPTAGSTEEAARAWNRRLQLRDPLEQQGRVPRRRRRRHRAGAGELEQVPGPSVVGVVPQDGPRSEG